eukprot:358859-Chlamydomonas_euryale.AAC.2
MAVIGGASACTAAAECLQARKTSRAVNMVCGRFNSHSRCPSPPSCAVRAKAVIPLCVGSALVQSTQIQGRPPNGTT